MLAYSVTPEKADNVDHSADVDATVRRLCCPLRSRQPSVKRWVQWTVAWNMALCLSALQRTWADAPYTLAFLLMLHSCLAFRE